ncbi:hypothetical protein PAAG_08523 [Paracoccidioides lutzii Pb01]|uniref:DUF4291 domain-containing protein n=1 Tax=Paracoccidioides lutzii (strain ATCC MYA-826 / Pb01) TaxID=502779 RepID=C1HCN2_PARBA|nr:hypothetical protein PAAG_08523 [Paracoccidioides lutzii Pb01]EEH38796.2 hypothetical protein PAAG_08523 [Paracoccidioides lutzii Pb01]
MAEHDAWSGEERYLPMVIFSLVKNSYKNIASSKEHGRCPIQASLITETMDQPNVAPTKYAIRAQYTSKTITVYQAYSPAIANAALSAGKFVAPFKRVRMTWIKPSFLWMAYRCGWATKKDQERVLAIEITREGFEWALAHACLSHPTPRLYADHAAWEHRKNESSVRVQWDPERDFEFRPLEYRSLQVGLKEEAVDRYVDEWTVGIRDVTWLMQEIGQLVREGKIEEARRKMPVEEVYVLPTDVATVVGAD